MDNNKHNELREKIAGVLKVNSTQVDENYLIMQGKLNTSAGRVIMNNLVKSIYGKSVNCKNVRTFGDLLQLVEGNEVAAETASEAKTRKNCISIAPVGKLTAGRLVCGIDIQDVSIFPISEDYWKEPFYTENFTKNEIAYCVVAESPVLSFAGRWCIKEALRKCGKEYIDIPFIDIQVAKESDGSTRLEIRNGEDEWIELPFSCSLSHSATYAVGMVNGIVG